RNACAEATSRVVEQIVDETSHIPDGTVDARGRLMPQVWGQAGRREHPVGHRDDRERAPQIVAEYTQEHVPGSNHVCCVAFYATSAMRGCGTGGASPDGARRAVVVNLCQPLAGTLTAAVVAGGLLRLDRAQGAG
ncbi:MAG TPA: hypothetical protein VIW70_09140, partial [Rubrivivax sp.]